MEYLFEFILELALEGSIEASKSKKLPKIIRYFLILIVVLFFILVIGLIILTGVLFLEENVIGGIFFILIGLYMFIMCILKFRKIYLLKIDE